MCLDEATVAEWVVFCMMFSEVLAGYTFELVDRTDLCLGYYIYKPLTFRDHLTDAVISSSRSMSQ
jgi:hypothetical protein